MSYNTKALFVSCVLMFSIVFMGAWIYECALTRTPAYLENLR